MRLAVATPLGCGLRERNARQQHERGSPSGERGCSGTRDGRYRPGAGWCASGRHAQGAHGENCSLRLVAGPPLPSQRRRRAGPHTPRGFPLPVPEVSSEPVCLALSLSLRMKQGPILVEMTARRLTWQRGLRRGWRRKDAAAASGVPPGICRCTRCLALVRWTV